MFLPISNLHKSRFWPFSIFDFWGIFEDKINVNAQGFRIYIPVLHHWFAQNAQTNGKVDQWIRSSEVFWVLKASWWYNTHGKMGFWKALAEDKCSKRRWIENLNWIQIVAREWEKRKSDDGNFSLKNSLRTLYIRSNAIYKMKYVGKFLVSDTRSKDVKVFKAFEVQRFHQISRAC